MKAPQDSLYKEYEAKFRTKIQVLKFIAYLYRQKLNVRVRN